MGWLLGHRLLLAHLLERLNALQPPVAHLDGLALRLRAARAR